MNGKPRKKRESQGKQPEFLRFCATAFDELWYLVKLNLLFLAGCAPVVTMPMALTAALRVTSLLAGGKRPPLWPEFRKAFLGEWKRALPCGWAFALAAGLAGYGAYSYGAMAGANPLALLLLLAAALIFAALTAAGLYFHSMLAMCELSLGDMLRNALILAVSEFRRSVLAVFALVMCIGASALFFPVTLPLAVFLLPALGLLAASFALRPGLLRCMLAGEDEEAGAR